MAVVALGTPLTDGLSKQCVVTSMKLYEPPDPKSQLTSFVAGQRAVLDDSDLYDTDLEPLAPNPDEEETRKQNFLSGATLYRKCCRKLSVVPQTVLIKNLHDKVISVKNRVLGPKAIEALAISLKQNSSIEKLDLTGNTMQADGVQHLVEALTTSEFITYVDLSYNRLGSKHSLINGAYFIGNMIRFNNVVLHLSLRGNDLDEQDAKYIAYGMEANDILLHLDLSHNCFREGGAKYIAKAIVENRNIETLNLSWNHIRKSGAVSICKALGTNKTITKLDLSWNGLGYEGSLALGHTLKRNNYLREIDISNNRIDFNSAMFIANGLKRNSSLEILRVGQNPITTTGAMDLLEGIAREGNSTKLLDLTDVPVLKEFELMSSTLRQARPGFRVIHGGVVIIHDPLGERKSKRTDPMRQVINMMTSQKLRPIEMFRNFDKEGSLEMTKGSFKDRLKVELKKNGFGLTKGEVTEIFDMLEVTRDRPGSAPGGAVSFMNLSSSMKDQRKFERIEKMKEQNERKKLRDYHRKILNVTSPVLPKEETYEEEKTMPSTNAKGFQTQVQRGTSSPAVTRTGANNAFGGVKASGLTPRPPAAMVTMSRSLTTGGGTTLKKAGKRKKLRTRTR